MTEGMYFDRDGQSIDLATYVRLHSDPAYRFLRRERVGRYEVVTAWLGADQSLGDDPSPAIFGTVALIDCGDELFEGREWWAPDEAAAMANHKRLVARRRSLAQ